MPGISESARSSKRNTPTELNAGDIARLARPVFERHNIERAILFGSFATGRQTIVGRFSASGDHPVALAFPEGDYLKGLLVRRSA